MTAPEELREETRIAPSEPALIAIERCATVLATSRNVDEIWQHGNVSDHLWPNTAASHTGGNTSELDMISRSLTTYQSDPADVQALADLVHARRRALGGLMKDIIQGKQVPVTDLPEAFEAVREGLTRTGMGSNEIDEGQKQLSLDLWKDRRDMVVRSRAAEAYRPVGSPLRYGLMMARIERYRQRKASD
jgi:hypothetical protein